MRVFMIVAKMEMAIESYKLERHALGLNTQMCC